MRSSSEEAGEVPKAEVKAEDWHELDDAELHRDVREGVDGGDASIAMVLSGRRSRA